VQDKEWVTYRFEIGIDLLAMSTDDAGRAVKLPAVCAGTTRCAWGRERGQSTQVLRVFVPQSFSPGTYAVGFVLADGRQAQTSFPSYGFAAPATTSAPAAPAPTVVADCPAASPGTPSAAPSISGPAASVRAGQRACFTFRGYPVGTTFQLVGFVYPNGQPAILGGQAITVTGDPFVWGLFAATGVGDPPGTYHLTFQIQGQRILSSFTLVAP
jgi:hypothetical protein